MFRNPYMRFPNPGRRPAPPPAPKEETAKHDPLFDNAAFSPQLSMMLSMVLKDGFVRNTAMDMLRNIYPYVEASDRAAIDKIFGVKEFAGTYRPGLNQSPFPGKAISKMERDLNLLRVLRKYASQDTASMFDRMEKSLTMQSEMSRMMKRMENLRNMKASNPDELLSTMEEFMPPEERKNIRNMTNMMNLFKNMGNFKPEDMMKMFGGMPFGNTNAR